MVEFYVYEIETIAYDTLKGICEIKFKDGNEVKFYVKHFRQKICVNLVFEELRHYKEYMEKLLSSRFDRLLVEPDDYEYTKFILGEEKL